MTQSDNRAASGTKRARSEGPRGDGDWTCPLCGNVNFAFRATCNMRKCGASKPADITRVGGGPIGPLPYDQSPALFMAGPGVPPPIQVGINGGYTQVPMPPPVSTIPYDYGGGMNLQTTYNPIPLPGAYNPALVHAVHHHEGVHLGSGFGAPVVDGYGMGMTMVPPPFSVMQIPGPRPGVQIEENGSRKRRGGPEGSEGDWICPKCGNSNFAFRTFCNMRKCGTPKPAEPVPRIAPQKANSQGPTPEGSWTCDACGNVNYPFRTKCNRRNCGVDKPADAKLTTKTSPPPSD
ncbi:ranBP2-type zinc finger protein At1g67325 [Selaginella moellendorffii]|uniref:ranBP2-type zinc finger protein At1g67325 n=1 Tax=Selaginella moellendorffii TaxID=88036 RepID=UPI000D1CE63E|nr:ranBP2-type zinc finger protein At1g67325 [Selaginella moellendorffii]XP_024522089.1 ranBP2-type zinc finger protein At1g67325 [Selaginella moellendorffii]|eukprot:XP_024522087.1 ranBP2-type zinc finger protein At1g67325 [Selaginella moellendorffii]